MQDPIKEILAELRLCTERTLTNQTAANYQLVQIKLSELGAAFRELYQAVTADSIKDVINKLDKKAPLNTEDIKLIRNWIVGDAETYLNNENSFNDWVKLFNNILDTVETQYDLNIIPDKILQLGAFIQIVNRLIPNINYYISERDRILSFERATSGGIDVSEATVYKDILLAKLESLDA